MPTLVTFLLLALTWGSSFLLMKIGLEGLAPVQVAWGRLMCGALALGVIAAVTRTPIPRTWAVLKHVLVITIFLCVVPFLLFSWAETHISSSLASILNATTPLMTAVIAMTALRDEPRTASRLVGLLLGFVGVVVLVAPWAAPAGDESPLLGQLACLAATFCYGIGFTYMRRFVSPLGLPALSVATAQVGLGALIMLVLTPVVASGSADLSPRVVLAIAALGALGTGLAYVWNTQVVAEWGATVASTVTYLTPVVGVALGILVLGERLTWTEPIGALLVILGIAVTQGRITLARR